MIKIALTGSIASGKSTLLEMARQEGYPVFSADRAVQTLYDTQPALVLDIQRMFPDAVLDGVVDKGRLARILYEDDVTMDSIIALRALVKPYVEKALHEFFDASARDGHSIVVCEIPFLFEANLHNQFHASVNTLAAPDNQTQRALARPGMTEHRLEKIRRTFYPPSIREAFADVTVRTDCDVAETRQTFLSFLERMSGFPTHLERTHRPPIVWVFGASSSGKTAIAGISKDASRNQGIAPSLGLQYMSSSEFFRAAFPKTEIDYLEGRPLNSFSADQIAELKAQFIEEISDFCSNMLKENPHCNIQFFKAKLAKATRPCVLDGFRNLFEFTNLYDPSRDLVIFLRRKGSTEYETIFEKGVSEIERNIRWMIKAGITPADSVTKFSFGDGRIDQTTFLTPERAKTLKMSFNPTTPCATVYDFIDELKVIASEWVKPRLKVMGQTHPATWTLQGFDAE